MSAPIGARHRATPELSDLTVDDAVAETFVRVAGVRLRSVTGMTQLREQMALPGRSGKRAHREMRREQRRRQIAIDRLIESEGWDKPMPGRTPRGFVGAGGGRMASIARLPEWRATTTQTAGLSPYCIGAAAPMLGTPVGAHLFTGEDVGFDPLAWMNAGMITAPILFVLALNGFGKSSLVRRIATGTMAQGHTVLFMGDVKPDYVGLTQAVAGQVIDAGPGAAKINPLAVGALGSIIPTLIDAGRDDLARYVRDQVHSRQVQAVTALIQLGRGSVVADFEETLISAILIHLYRPVEQGGGGFTHNHPPLLHDMYGALDESPPDLWAAAGADDRDQFRDITRRLRQALKSIVDGPLGEVFNHQTTTAIDVDAPAVCIDVSKIPDGQSKLKAAILLTCWSDGFGAVEAAHTLADAGLSAPRQFLVVMDELWQVLAEPGMVDKVNALTRLNRQIGTALILITHTIKDLASFESQADVNKALGFIERARAKIIGPVGPDELERLGGVMSFTNTEKRLITSWSTTPPPTAATIKKITAGQRQSPPGTGCFMLKVGEDDRPGIPFRLNFTPSEASSGVHDTNQRFSLRSGQEQR